MAIETQETREIIDFAPEGEGFLVTSLYLDTSADSFPSEDLLKTSFDSLMHTAESRRKEIEANLSHESRESVRGDLEKIREFYDHGFNRDDTNGLAIFSCSAQDFWQVVHIPTPVVSMVEFGEKPYVSPLATFLSHSKPTAILVTDRKQARIFTMSHGDVREWTNFDDYVPSRGHAGGWSQMRYQRRSDNWARHHVDHGAELTFKLLQHYPFDWLIVGCDVDAQHDLLNDLHPYLKDRLIGQIHVRIDADASEVLEKARELREQTEERTIETLMGQVQEFAGAGGRGTIGLDDTLQALNEQKIHILLVQGGYSHPGAVCDSCGMLMPEKVERCPACNEPARTVDNVLDSAIQRAMELGSVVEVATEFNELEPISCIGSIMYY